MRKNSRLFSCILIWSFVFSTLTVNVGGDEKATPINDFFADYALVAPPKPVYLPIIMYHQISRIYSRLDTYIISDEEFESDLKLLKDNGYTTITTKELTDFVLKKEPLPDKPVMLTFDDGFQSDYIYAFPLLQKYNMKAIFSIIGKYTDMFSEADVVKHVNYAHLSWEEIKQMNDSGLAEFQNHTYDMHVVDKRRGALPRKHESDEEYQRTIRNDLGKLNEEYKMHIGVEPVAFTCPFGCFNDRLKEAVRDAGFSIIFTSYQKINKLSGDPEELMKLNRFLRSHNKNVEKLINSWEEFYSVDNTKN